MTQCPENVGSERCMLEDDHEGAHRIEYLIPPEVGGILDGLMEHTEGMANAYERARKRLEFYKWVLLVCSAINVGCSIWALTR